MATMSRLRASTRVMFGRGGARHHPESSCVVNQVGDLCAPDLVFAGKAVGIRAGAADQFALDDGGAVPRLGHLPSQNFAAYSTAEDEHVIAFRLGHLQLPRDGCSAASGAVNGKRAQVKTDPLSRARPVPNAPGGVIIWRCPKAGTRRRRRRRTDELAIELVDVARVAGADVGLRADAVRGGSLVGRPGSRRLA